MTEYGRWIIVSIVFIPAFFLTGCHRAYKDPDPKVVPDTPVELPPDAVPESKYSQYCPAEAVGLGFCCDRHGTCDLHHPDYGEILAWCCQANTLCWINCRDYISYGTCDAWDPVNCYYNPPT